MSEPVLEIRNLVKTFPIKSGIILERVVGHVQAVSDVSFAIARGETLGLVGEQARRADVARLAVAYRRRPQRLTVGAR